MASVAAEIPDRMFFRIGDVATIVGVKPFVLRYWESEFSIISPQKSTTGQRVYRKVDVENLLLIKHLLYKERYSIEGARKRLRELKGAGELTDYTRENILGGNQHLARQQRETNLRDCARELADLARRPMNEIFKL